MSKEELRNKYEDETGLSHGNALFSTTSYSIWLEKQFKELKERINKAESKLLCAKHSYHLTYEENLKDYYCYKCESN